jgi:TRAP-type C4-dicarboxylate transport system permease small subunit
MNEVRAAQANPINRLVDGYIRQLRRLVMLMAFLAGASICAMMLVTCIDVIGRAFNHPLPGAYDIVKILGVLTIACGLPYTTAVKGHVAVEFFFQKMPRRLRVLVDTLNRLLVIALFGILSWQSVQYGAALHQSGEVTPTMQIPVFWVPYVIAVSCGIVVLVVLQNLLHPGKVMIRP